MSKQKISKRFKLRVGQILTVLLLILYVAGSSNLEIFHSMVHDHALAVTHSEEEEKDPCHQLIYHHNYDAEQECNHEEHLIASDKCEMCDLAFRGDQNFLSNPASSNVEFPSRQFDFYKLSLDSYWAVISSSRAPPIHA